MNRDAWSCCQIVIGQCRQTVHAALVIFEATVQTPQLAGVDNMPALPALGTRNPIKAIIDRDRGRQT